MIVKINPKTISLDKKFQGMCKNPYYNHPKGCPYYGKRDICPPGLPLLDEILDFEKDIYLIYTPFRVGKKAEENKINHPDWNLRQIYNSRHWQGTARKKHKLEIEEFIKNHPEMYVETNAEAHGTNLTDLMETQGIKLDWQWPPEHNVNNITYRVSIAGVKK
ncbi:hypothetical protein GW932_02710 [archaeon]|nr:hypothetical protein [archaeon]